jgi:fermentation-respiration switch protein FrsA (DUF1100 family)
VSQGVTVSPVRTLPTLVWYPLRPGRSPLLVFAHGFDVDPLPYRALLEAWAAEGYVVAAPEFPLTDPDLAGARLDESDINQQPADVRFVTDQLLSPASPVTTRIDPDRVGLAGHSDGAETVLAASVAPAPPGEPRYRGVVVMSGQPVPGAAGRNPPMLVIQGDVDTINPPSLGLSAYQQAAAPKYLLTLQGGGHLPPYEAGSSWLAPIESVTGAFFDSYVAGDAPAGSVATSAGRSGRVSLRFG